MTDATIDSFAKTVAEACEELVAEDERARREDIARRLARMHQEAVAAAVQRRVREAGADRFVAMVGQDHDRHVTTGLGLFIDQRAPAQALVGLALARLGRVEAVLQVALAPDEPNEAAAAMADVVGPLVHEARELLKVVTNQAAEQESRS